MTRFGAMQKSVQVLREPSPRGSYARRRAAALAGAGIFFVGLLDALGLGHLVLLALAGVAAVVAVVAGGRLLRRGRPWSHAPAAGRSARAAGAAFATASRRGLVRLRPMLERLGAGIAGGARAARGSASPRLAASVRRARELGPVVERVTVDVERISGAARARLSARLAAPQDQRREPQPVVVDRQREALQLNADGARLRREGAYDDSVRQHQAALDIFRELGDRRAEALTLNNVALAKGRAGDEETAVARFEEALAILRELADPQHEAQVTANLGITLRRHGHDDRAKELLEAALAKLDPGSPAAQQVEGELRRAS